MTDSASLSDFIESLEATRAGIAPKRREVLTQFAARILEFRQHSPVRLNFICTHNSRRSHLSQIWAQTAAAHHGVEGLETYSGGTEATAFDRRAIAALRRCGFEVTVDEVADNPHYRVRGLPGQPVLECFSKVYTDPPNPASDYLAVMTCSSADAVCSALLGARDRFVLTYEDPKKADGTPEESAVYDARCRQIAAEALLVWGLVAAGA